jgi:hypothetical protein
VRKAWTSLKNYCVLNSTLKWCSALISVPQPLLKTVCKLLHYSLVSQEWRKSPHFGALEMKRIVVHRCARRPEESGIAYLHRSLPIGWQSGTAPPPWQAVTYLVEDRTLQSTRHPSSHLHYLTATTDAPWRTEPDSSRPFVTGFLWVACISCSIVLWFSVFESHPYCISTSFFFVTSNFSDMSLLRSSDLLSSLDVHPNLCLIGHQSSWIRVYHMDSF